MSKKIKIDFKGALEKAKKLLSTLVKHAAFVAILVILFVYLFVLLRISQFAGAEPSAAEDTVTTAQIPKVDKKAIEQIQALEQNNTGVKSFFNSARNNPFSE